MKRHLVETLIDRVVKGQDPSLVLQSFQDLAENITSLNPTIDVGVDVVDTDTIKTFFDGTGRLRFCNEGDVLIRPSSDPRLIELMQYADALDVDNELFDLFETYEGTLSELYKQVTDAYYLVKQIGT